MITSKKAVAVDADALRFNLFYRFATSELTHSGIWAWILQSLDSDCPDSYRELRPAARALLDAMGVGEVRSPISVRREWPLPGGAGRVDIEMAYGTEQVVVIETKVKARPDAAQRERYAAAYRAAGHRLAGIAILSTTFDEPLGGSNRRHLGASALLRVLRAQPSYQLDIMQQYVAWLEHVIAARAEAVTRALSEDLADSSAALLTQEAQWGVMRMLAQGIGDAGAMSLSAGTNNGGSRWTQLTFSRGGAPNFDALFYRLDARPNCRAELTLRQYQKPAAPDKQNRLMMLRALFRESVQEVGTPMGVFDTQPKWARLRAEEAQVAQAAIAGDVTLPLLLAHLPRVHNAFARRLRQLGWPMGAEEPDASA